MQHRQAAFDLERFPMGRLSIIIPIPRSSAQLEETLLSVLENRPDDCEVLVIHCGTYDDPYELNDEVEFVELAAGTSLLECIQTGVNVSHGEFIHLLAQGLTVQPQWADAALLHFQNPQCAAVFPLAVHRNDPDDLLCAGVSLGTAGFRQVCGMKMRGRRTRNSFERLDGPTVEAAFYRRAALEYAGDFSGDNLADIDPTLSLRAIGFSTVVATDSHVVGPAVEKLSDSGFFPGVHADRLLLQHQASTGWKWPLVLRPAVLALQVLINMFTGRRFSEWRGWIFGLTKLRHANNHQFQTRRVASNLQQAERQRTRDVTYRFDDSHVVVQKGTSTNHENKRSQVG